MPRRIYRAAREVQERAFYRRGEGFAPPGGGCYNHTIEDVLKHQYTPKQLSRFRTAAARIQKLTRWVRRNFKPNWPLMERVTKADEGVLR